MTVKAPHRFALQAAGLAAVMTATLIPSVAGAQRQQCPGPETKRVLVTTFRGDPAAGINVADEIRNRIQGEYNCRTLMPNIKKDIDNALVSSGYRADSALNPADIKELGKIVHADEIIDGTVARTATGYRVNARFFLPRDVALSQPLGTFESKDFGDIAKKVVDEYDRARKQISDNQACENGIRENNPAKGIAAARKGLINYPKSTLLRLCMASAYSGMKATADSTTPWRDSVIAITTAIIAMDNTSRIAYQLSYDAYKSKGDADNAINTLIGWMGADPTNNTLREQVIAELVTSGKAKLAVPIVRTLVTENPGDPAYMKMMWQVYRADKNYKESVPAGIAWVMADTAAADSSYFDRQIFDLAADSNYAKVAEMAAQAAAKYPRSTNYLLQKASAERRLGQLPAAKATLERALEIDPKVSGANYILAQVSNDLGNIDDVIKYAKADVAQDAANKERAGTLVLAAGNKLYQAGVASKSPADYKKAIPILQAANEINPSPNAEFLIGVSGFQAVAAGAQELQKSTKCEDYREANELLTLASTLIPRNGKVSPDAAGQIMGAIPQYSAFIESSIRRHCKPASTTR